MHTLVQPIFESLALFAWCVMATAVAGAEAPSELKSLNPEQAQELVGQFQNQTLSLDGVTAITDETAEALAKHVGALSLNGLTTLTDEAAKALASHWGDLSLNGLPRLTDEAAEALAKHAGTLSLNGLTTLTDEAAKALARHKNDLRLNGLATLSDNAAKALSQHKGNLDLLGLTTLTDEVAKEFAQHKFGRVAMEKAAADKLAREKSAAQELAAEKAAEEKLAIAEAAAEKVATEEAAAEKAAAGTAEELAKRLAAAMAEGKDLPTVPSPWSMETATGLNDNGRAIDKAIAAGLGKVSQHYLERSFRGVTLGDRYTPSPDDVASDPWLLPTNVKQQDGENLEAVVRVLVDAKSGRTIGVFAVYRLPLDAMIEPIKKTFGKTFHEIDSREVMGFDFDCMTLKYTFPSTIVRVSGHRFRTVITVLDRDYTEAALRPFANAVLSACRWVKKVANYGGDHKNGPVQDVPLADLQRARNSSQSLLLLSDASAQQTARERHKGDQEVRGWDIATAWNNDTSQGAVVNLLACGSSDIPKLLLSEDDYVDRTLATAGVALDLFHEVGSALIQSEFPPAGDTITVRNPRLSWDGDCTTSVDPSLGETDEGILARAQFLEQVGQPHQLRRAYEWTDKQGWKITLTESLVLTIIRGEKEKGL